LNRSRILHYLKRSIAACRSGKVVASLRCGMPDWAKPIGTLKHARA
jgi:hypothetical protein